MLWPAKWTVSSPAQSYGPLMPWFVLPWLVVVFTIVTAILLRAHSPWVRLALSIGSVALLTYFLWPTVGSTLDPHFSTDTNSFEALSEKLFVAAWWIGVARIGVVTGQILLKINHQAHSARLALDLVAGAIYLGAVLAIVDLVFGVSVTGLVATSGIIAIVLGLALQNTLGDLFSGIAIGIDRPFKVGDLIWIEGPVEGRVIETNWRSTRIATGANDIATVPNSVIAKSRILNRSSPTETRTETVKVVLDPAVSPRKGVTLLRAAALNTVSLILHPAPKVNCLELGGAGATYEISFSASISSLGNARSDLLQQVARHARYGGVALATQNGTPLVPVAAPDLSQLLHETLVLEALTDEECAVLASRLVVHRGETGDKIFDQGGELASLFIIANGTFEVTRDDGQGSRRLGTIGPGDYFGELALLTGEPNAVTVTALTPFLAYEVGKAMIEPLLEENPDLLHAFEEGASKAQALFDRTIAAQACSSAAPNGHLLDRIRAFFNVKEGVPPRTAARSK
jgi:small-conductance mechanosensitive channel/CRP-like cAMP-binding protein